MKCLIILLFIASPLLIDLWREQCAYWELCRKQKEEDQRIQEIVNKINKK